MEPKPYGWKDPEISKQEEVVHKATSELLSFAREPKGLWYEWNKELIERAEQYRQEFHKLHMMRNPPKEQTDGGKEG